MIQFSVMDEKEYIIFCDESDVSGKYYSNFYGGVLVGTSQYQRIMNRLDALKVDLNLYGEVKWEKVSQNYLVKYQSLMECFFEEISAGNLRLRIMFRQNAYRSQGLTQDHIQDTYFKLYYQFIKHAFGLQHIESGENGTRLRLYFDQFPDTKEKAEQFKGYLMGLGKSSGFQNAKIILTPDNITEVKSHDHVILQCLDVVLGAMTFRLNEKHKKIPGTKKRGRRTIAKEALYKKILHLIRDIYPNFNIGISTSCHGDITNRWKCPYMHWAFVPQNGIFDRKLTKGKED